MKIFKILFCIIGIAIVLMVLGLWGAYLYFTPDRIVNIIEKESSKYLNGEIKIGNLDYKIFKSYPWIDFEVESINVISHSLVNIPSSQRDSIPPNANLLASIKKISGCLNIIDLLHKKLSLNHIKLVEPKFNIVIVNENVNNFSVTIPSKDKMNFNFKDFYLGEIMVEEPLKIYFFSLPQSLNIKSEIERFYLVEESEKTYDLRLGANFEGKYKNISSPGKIPVSLNLSVTLNPQDLSILLSDFNIKIHDVLIDFKGNLTADKNAVNIEGADLGVSIPDLFALKNEVPDQLIKKIKIPENLTGHLPLELNCRLSHPFTIQKTHFNDLNIKDLPHLFIEAITRDGSLTYSPKNENPIVINNVAVVVEGNFNPEISTETYINILELKLQGEGLEISANARCDNFTGEEQSIVGKMKFQSNLLRTLSHLIPGLGAKINGHLQGNFDFNVLALNLGHNGLKDIDLKGEVNSKKLSVEKLGNTNISADNIHTLYYAFLPAYPIKSYQNSEINFGLTADNIIANQNKESQLDLNGLKFRLNIDPSIKGGTDLNGDIRLNINDMATKNKSGIFSCNGVDISANGHLLSVTPTSAPEFSQEEGNNGKIIAEKITHTPFYLENSGEGMIQTFLNMIMLKVDANLQEGNIKLPSYIYPFSFSGLSLSTDLNKFSFTARDVEIARTGFSITGIIDGVKDFFCSSYPTLLKADADINFSNVDINQLSWGYYGVLKKEGVDSIYYLPSLKPYTHADSICILIPRNIDANIRLKSKSAEYLNYTFSPLQTSIIVKNGNATLKRLTIGAPYCDLAVDWIYSTQKLDSIYMDLKADVNDFNFEKFYGAFPKLVDKTVELKNLNGDLSAAINCHFLLFPTMFLDAPSLSANFDIKGQNFIFKREGKFEKITHLMLIDGNEPIHIRNFNITGGFHDNLLQINPFKLDFDDYQIGFGGINNMQGDIYYHIALEKSPFHLPFGVNLEGKFSDPKVKIGGTSFDDKKGELITNSLEWNPELNIMASLKHGWTLFMQQAAKYEEKMNNN